MRRFVPVLIAVLVASAALSVGQNQTTGSAIRGGSLRIDEQATTAPFDLEAGTYAVFHTSDGDFIARLLEKDAPKTVENFVQLATGAKKWQHPITMVEMDKPLYNNTLFYRIVRDVLVRGGDPVNRETGGPGYELDMENVNAPFDTAGLLAMENTGTKSSGSRWFVSLSPFPNYKGRYTIFGKVVGGIDVVREISRKPTKKPSVPLEPTLLNTIEILTVPAGLKTTANFTIEADRKVLNVDKNFAPANGAPSAAATTTAATTATTAQTTATAQTTTTTTTATTATTPPAEEP